MNRLLRAEPSQQFSFSTDEQINEALVMLVKVVAVVTPQPRFEASPSIM